METVVELKPAEKENEDSNGIVNVETFVNNGKQRMQVPSQPL